MRKSHSLESPEWAVLEPKGAAELVRGLGVPWWIAGGWALDLFLGARTRHHEDVDVSVRRVDQLRLQEHLAGWDVRVAHEGELAPWRPGERLEPPLHTLWARPRPDEPWLLEFLLMETAGERWLYRRDPSISRLLADATATTEEGLPYLRPEHVLLYKSKSPRPRDDADFARVAPALDAGARDWLTEALRATDRSHPWLEVLQQPGYNRGRMSG